MTIEASLVEVLKVVSVAGFCVFCLVLAWVLFSLARYLLWGSLLQKTTIDRYLVASFAIFLFVAWFFEPAVIYQCGWEGLAQCDTLVGKLWFFYASSFDPVFLNLPLWLRLVCSLDTLLFAPFYAFSLRAFCTGQQESVWYMLLALPFSGALIYSTVVYFGYELLAEAHRASLFWVFVINLPWTLAPFALIMRLGVALKELSDAGSEVSGRMPPKAPTRAAPPLGWRTILACVPVGLLFIMAGVGHFNNDAFIDMMRGMPFPTVHPAAVYISGAAEFVLGSTLLIAPLLGPRGISWVSKAAWLLFVLVILVTPANINMYVNDVPFGGSRFTYGLTGTHFKRFVAQVVLFAWLGGLVIAADSADARRIQYEMGIHDSRNANKRPMKHRLVTTSKVD